MPRVSLEQLRAIHPDVEFRNCTRSEMYLIGSNGTVWSRYGEAVRIPGYRAGFRRTICSDYTPIAVQWSRAYPSVPMSIHGRECNPFIHHLVLEAFVGPRPKGMEGCHENGVYLDCRLSNLRWDTHKNNEKDKYRHGTVLRGEKNGCAKLTEQKVLTIRSRAAKGDRQADIGRDFGITQAAVSLIHRRRKWAHV